jgi:hypothetical protein
LSWPLFCRSPRSLDAALFVRQRNPCEPARRLSIVKDTWGPRDLPVLDATVSLLEEMDLPKVAAIVERVGLSTSDVALALEDMDGEYVDLQMTMGDPGSWSVRAVTPGARRAVGQWPTAEGLADRLAVAFGEAADDERDPERKNRLRQIASFLADTGKDVAAEVLAKVILRPAGMR